MHLLSYIGCNLGNPLNVFQLDLLTTLLIKYTLNTFSVSYYKHYNMMLSYCTIGPKSSPPLVEPHFGTLYWTEPLPQALIELWRTVKPSADLVGLIHP